MRSRSPALANLARLIVVFGVIFSTTSPVAADGGDLRSDQVELLTTEDGLVDSFVFELELDARGFLWLATNTYLQRYDGYRFETFKHDPEDPASPAPGTTVAISRGRGGGMWFGTQGGVVLHYEPAEDRFISYLPDSRDSRRLPEELIEGLTEDSRGRLWVVSQGRESGLSRLDPATGEVTRYRHDSESPDSLSPGQVWGVLEDREGILWVGTSSGLDRFVPETDLFVHYPWPGLGRLFEDSQGRLWASFREDDERDDMPHRRDGLLRFDHRRGSFERFVLPASWPAVPTAILSISEDRQGMLWLATSHGAVCFDPGSGAFSRFRQESTAPGGLATDEVNDIAEDRSGVLWFATRNNGLAKLDRRRWRFEIHRLAPPGSDGLDGRHVSALEPGAEDILWVGTDTGLHAFDRTGGGVETFPITLEAGPNRLPGQGTVRSILQDRQGTLWVTTDFGGIVRRPAGADDFERIDGSAPYSPVVFEDTDGRLWVPTWSDGVYRLDPVSGRLRSLLEHGEVASTWSMHEDSGGALWLMTMDGVFRIGETRDEPIVERHAPEISDAPLSELVDFYEDAEGIFWIATSGSGLLRWDRRQDLWRAYDERDGLASNHIASLLADDGGLLWLATKAGLSRFDPRTESFRTFTTGDGLHDDQFLIRSAARLETGELAFGGPGGLTIVSPWLLDATDPVVPPVVLTELRLDGEVVEVRSRDDGSPLERAITEAHQLELEHGYRSIDLEFAALHFANPERNRFAYRLEGFEPGWTETDAGHRRARYTSLSPGAYTFRVKAANPDGLWNENGASLRIVVLPPWWRTGWAYGAYLLLASGSLYGAYRIQQGKLEREQLLVRRLREIDRRKDELLATTSHELRTPLNGIIGLAEALAHGAGGEPSPEMRENLGMIVASGRRLARLVDDILDFSKLRQDDLALDLRPIDLHSVADIVLTLSRPAIGDKNIELKNAVATSLPPALADENRIQQILHNLVGNAIKFTEEGEVEVSAAVFEGGERLRVQRKTTPASRLPGRLSRKARERGIPEVFQGSATKRERMHGRPNAEVIFRRTLRVVVADTGIGIPAEKQEQIFEVFEQADSSFQRAHGGIGLGLSVARKLVELHGGSLWVESSPGEGARFSFTLPAADRSATPTQPVARARLPVAEVERVATKTGESLEGRRPADGGRSGARILVVDDEMVNLQVVSGLLALEGHVVEPVTSGPEALAWLERRTFDLVILDVMMPGMSGYEVCRLLREQHSLQALPVIFLTALEQPADRVAGLAVGGNDYLVKPINKDELSARVRTHLELASIHRRLAVSNAELTRFNYTVAHDLRNPLTTITNYLGMVRHDLDAGQPEHLERNLDRLDAAAHQLRQLLDELFELSKVGLQTSPSEEVALGELARQALAERTDALTDRGVEVRVAPDLPVVSGDRARLREVVRHLVDNAFKYLGDQPTPRIEIGVRRVGGQETRRSIVFVRDNGSGIDPQYHEKIFDLFERLDPSVSQGTGIGLALVKRIIEHHGGRIWVESEGEGHGSTFCFILREAETAHES